MSMERNANRVVDVRLDKLGRALGLEIQRRLMDKTPVDTGRARGNWNASIGEPDFTTSETTSAAATIAKASAVVRGFELSEGASFYVSNGLPYIERLEEGYSAQAPNGMVRVTVAELKPLAERIGASLNRG